MKNTDINETPTDVNNVLCTVPLSKDIILEYLKNKKPDQRFIWHKTEKWVAKYETVISLNRALNIPKNTIYRVLKQLKGTQGFSFSQKLISYEYRVE